MGIGQGDDLSGVGGVGEDLLIAGHGGVENHLTYGLTLNTNGRPAKQAAVLKGE